METCWPKRARGRVGPEAQGLWEEMSCARAPTNLPRTLDGPHALAPRTLETLEELRSCSFLGHLSNWTQQFLQHHFGVLPEVPLQAPGGVYARNASGVSGRWSNLLQMFTSVSEDFARAAIPRVVFNIVQQANMTLLKRDGGVRGFAAGTSFCRVGGKEFGEAVQQGSGTSMCSVPIRPRKEGRHRLCGYVIRALTDATPTATVLSVDGIGAHDHTFRGAMLSKLFSEPVLHGLHPFVRAI